MLSSLVAPARLSQAYPCCVQRSSIRVQYSPLPCLAASPPQPASQEDEAEMAEPGQGGANHLCLLLCSLLLGLGLLFYYSLQPIANAVQAAKQGMSW